MDLTRKPEMRQGGGDHQGVQVDELGNDVWIDLRQMEQIAFWVLDGVGE